MQLLDSQELFYVVYGISLAAAAPAVNLIAAR